jgi:hypothetical protein
MVECLRTLHNLANLSDSATGFNAADSINSIEDMANQIECRLVDLSSSQFQDVRLAGRSVGAAMERLDIPNHSANGTLMTLSPSDFGPHNIMADFESGKMRLIDLEFFGWDDAHKLLCDTLLHPLIDWRGRDVSRFISDVSSIYGLYDSRLAQLLPWCSLKWSTIVLARAERLLRLSLFDAANVALGASDRFLSRALEYGKWSARPTDFTDTFRKGYRIEF